MKIELYYQDKEGDCKELKIGNKYNVTLKATLNGHIWITQFGITLYKGDWLTQKSPAINIGIDFPRTPMGLYILSQDDMITIRKMINKTIFETLGIKYDSKCL